MFKKFFIHLLLALGLVFALSSCTVNNQQSRISENPALYLSLDSDEQALVQRGEIKKGMHKKGVYLAWGNPSRSTKGNSNGSNYERWYYVNYVPTYTTGIYAGYGYSKLRYYGGYRTYHNDYKGEFEKKVEFRNDLVYSWESVK